jgi:hypothetical protein
VRTPLACSLASHLCDRASSNDLRQGSLPRLPPPPAGDCEGGRMHLVSGWLRNSGDVMHTRVADNAEDYPSRTHTSFTMG